MKRVATWAFYAVGALAIGLSRALRLCDVQRPADRAGRPHPHLPQAGRAELFVEFRSGPAPVGWAKAPLRRAHHLFATTEVGGHASLCPPYGTSVHPRKIASASAWARGTMLSSSRYSSGVCACRRPARRAQMVGVPTAAVKPESAQPPENSPCERGEADLLRRGLIAFEQRLRVRALHHRHELALDRQRRAGAGHVRCRDDLLDRGHDRAHDPPDRHSAGRSGPRRRAPSVLTDCPPETRPTFSVMPLVEIGQRVDLDDLVRELADGADARGEIGAGMRGFAGDVQSA